MWKIAEMLDRAAADDRPTPPAGEDRPIVIVSNRGPVSFRRDESGDLVPRRGAGGLVSGLAPLVVGTETSWIAAALSDDDRAAATANLVEADGFRVRLLDIDQELFRRSYDEVCNAALWFAHHGLYDLARTPAFGPSWPAAWAAYEAVNEAFADAVVETAPEHATVLVQDYHLCLLAGRIAERRADLRCVHFAHTPFATPDWLRVLPDPAPRRLLEGLAAHHACGFHAPRWAAAFEACCDQYEVPRPATFVAPLGPDPDDMATAAASEACERSLATLDDVLGDRLLITRVDRIELSKNLVRGFEAYDLLLDQRPEWRGRVVMAASVYPSREGVAAYATYRREVEQVVAAINERWGTPDWQPVRYDDSDDFPGSVAALRRADVLLVNPILDGLNLVAKEGPLVNERDVVLVLSTDAGAWAELEGTAIGVNPFDVAATAEALHRGLSMPAAERAAHAAAVRACAGARTPADWLADQVQATTGEPTPA
jgi:trehalose 6-phosphate synthase